MAHDNKDIPKGWTETTLGEFIDVKHGYAFSGEFITDIENNNVLLTPGNFLVGGGWKYGKKFYSGNDIPSEYILKFGDIVLTMTDLSKDGDTLGYPAVIPNNINLNFLHNQRVGLIKFTGKEISKDFLYWKLRTKDYQKTIVNSSTGSTVRHTSPGRIKEYKFLLPPLPEQRAIADMLLSLDAKIELLREQNETLEQTKQTIFYEWFGRYSVERPEEFPERWRVGKLGEITEIKGGSTPSTQNTDFWNGDIAWTSPKDLSNSKEVFLLQTESKITSEGLKQISSGLLPIGTLLLSSRAPIGYLAITNIEVAINQGYIAFIDGNHFGNKFMYLWLKTNMQTILNSANGSTFLEISKSSFRNIEVVIPSKNIIDEFEVLINPVFEKILSNLLQIQSLSKTRDTLLPKLMSGEVRV